MTVTLDQQPESEPATLLGVPYWTRGRQELETLLREAPGLVELNGVNAEVTIQARDDADHHALLAENPTNLIDGQGVCRLLQLKYGRAFDRISGSDYTTELCALAHDLDWKVFLLGGTEEASEGTQAFLEDRFKGLRVSRYSPPFDGSTGGQPAHHMHAETEKLIRERLDAERPELLIGCFGAPKQEFWFRRNRDWLESRGVRVWMGAGGTFDFLSGRLKRAPQLVSNIGFEWLWRFAQQPRARFGRIGKRLPRFAVLGMSEALRYRLGSKAVTYRDWGSRAFSLGVLALGLPIALAVSLGVAMANLLAFGSARRIFFTQTRVGKEGKTFTLIKFRTMRESGDSFGSWSHSKDRLRVTRLGRVLRSSHLDELPQLWNVLRGDMNLVGPRPEMVEVHDWATREVPGFERRLRVRPGLTGLAQITQGYTGHCPDAYGNKLAIDEAYIEKQSLGFDLRISCGTLRWMLLGKGWSWQDGVDSKSVPRALPSEVSVSEVPAADYRKSA